MVREGNNGSALRTAVVYSTDGSAAWRTRLSIASLVRRGIDPAHIFILSPGAHAVRDMYVSEHSTQIDVSGVLRDELGMPCACWQGKWHYAILGKLAAPLLCELSGFDQALYLDTDTLAHTDALRDLMAYPCNAYEAVGGAHYMHGLGFGGIPTTLMAQTEQALRKTLTPEQYDQMRSKIWAHNPLLYRVWFNDGVFLMNLNRIRSDIPWYVQRVAWLYSMSCHADVNGMPPFLTETFYSAFMDSAALLPVDLVVHNGTETPVTQGRLTASAFVPAVVHYNGLAYDALDSDMVRDARKLGLDEAAFEHV